MPNTDLEVFDKYSGGIGREGVRWAMEHLTEVRLGVFGRLRRNN